MLVVLYSKTGNDCDIVYPIEGEINDIIKKDIEDITTNYIIVRSEDLPSREFRSSWILRDKKLCIDLNIVKRILKEKFRVDRAERFKKLDLEFMLALERGETEKLEKIKNIKQQLRDITKIEMPDDFNELKDFYPDILKEDQTF